MIFDKMILLGIGSFLFTQNIKRSLFIMHFLVSWLTDY